jgi:hypothetical protein
VDLTQQDLDGTDRRDAGGIVIGWMTKLVVVFAIIGVLGYDGIAVGVGHLSTADDAGNAAQAASQTYQSSHNVNTALASAQAVLKVGEALDASTFSIEPDGTTSVTLTRTVHTLVLYRTSKTAGLAVITAHATGKYTGS